MPASHNYNIQALNDFLDRIGEVDASPTANTVLARLKALLTGVILGAGSAIIGKVGIDQTTPGTTDHVSPIAGQAGIAAGAGVDGATVPRVTLATNVSLPAGTNLLGKVGIDQTTPGTTDHVSPISGQAGIAAGAGAVGVTVPRITLASDDPGVAALNKLNALASAVEVVPTQIIKTVAAIATPEALAADGTFFRSAVIVAKKAARTANTGNVYLGIGATNDTQPYEIAPGDVLRISSDPGTRMDLNDWCLDVLNAGDGVVVIYS